MKNVTITLDEKVARWARAWAARHKSSVSRLIGELLERRMREERGYEAAMKQFLAGRPVPLKKGGCYPRRDEINMARQQQIRAARGKLRWGEKGSE